MKKLIFIISLFSLWGGTFVASARYRGDLNGDNRVDLSDMVYLAKAIKEDTADKALDVNASGKVDDADLQKLADIIISGSLTEDGGLNVGIGGWEDDGDDYGGTVKAPAFPTRSGEGTRFYMGNPKSEGDNLYSMEFGISEGSEAPSAMFLNIRLPRELNFDPSKMIELENSLSSTHRLYGTPKFRKENEEDEWSDWYLRFIVFSPDMKPLAEPMGKIGRICYTPDECWGGPTFKDCQVAMPGGDGCTYLEEHGGGYDGNFKPVEVTSVWFDQTEMTLTEGNEGWLYANIDPWDATDQTLVWTSSDESVATVYSEDGRNAIIKALNGGEAVITATSSNGLTASCTVRVEKRYIEVSNISLSQDNLTMTEGDAVTLVATIDPEDATDKTIEWTSSDETIAVVNANGQEATVTALAPGNVEIIASASNGQSATCQVTVEQRIIEVSGIVLSSTEMKLTEGEAATLIATIQPEDATDKTLTWTSSDESVATVSANGEVKAIKAGIATIMVSSTNGKTATCQVTVEARIIEVESVTLDKESLTLTEGENATLTATINPADATDKTLAWTSSDESVATVNANGEVMAIKAGTVTITVSAANGKTATCKVTVERKIIEVSGIVLSSTEMKLTEGEAATLIATIQPEDATDKALTWTSSDESVATVSADGEVKAIKAGIATIMVSSTNGKTATCVVKVEAKIIEMEAILLDTESLSLIEGEEHQFSATVIPAETTYPDIEWWVDDESVASVDQNGLVTMIREGETKVHVRSVYWNAVEAMCILNVISAVEDLIEDNAPCDIYTTNGVLIKKNADHSYIDNLSPGIYIIRQGRKTTKLLK